jgi:transcriptional regulator with XRE-family HTH domain
LNVYTGTKTQTEIAKAVGFNSPNMLSMIKTGKTKLPLKRVAALSRELSIPIEELFLLVLDQNYPGSKCHKRE